MKRVLIGFGSTAPWLLALFVDDLRLQIGLIIAGLALIMWALQPRLPIDPRPEIVFIGFPLLTLVGGLSLSAAVGPFSLTFSLPEPILLLLALTVAVTEYSLRDRVAVVFEASTRLERIFIHSSLLAITVCPLFLFAFYQSIESLFVVVVSPAVLFISSCISSSGSYTSWASLLLFTFLLTSTWISFDRNEITLVAWSLLSVLCLALVANLRFFERYHS